MLCVVLMVWVSVVWSAGVDGEGWVVVVVRMSSGGFRVLSGSLCICF